MPPSSPSIQRHLTMWRSPPLSPFHDAVMVHQPSHLDGDHHFSVLSMDFFTHLLQALCAFAHVPHELYSTDCQPFLGFIFFNVDNCLVDLPCCVNDHIAICQCHCHFSVLVGNYHESTSRVSLHCHDPDVGQCLLVEKRIIDHRCNFLVHLGGQKYMIICYKTYESLCHA